MPPVCCCVELCVALLFVALALCIALGTTAQYRLVFECKALLDLAQTPLLQIFAKLPSAVDALERDSVEAAADDGGDLRLDLDSEAAAAAAEHDGDDLDPENVVTDDVAASLSSAEKSRFSELGEVVRATSTHVTLTVLGQNGEITDHLRRSIMDPDFKDLISRFPAEFAPTLKCTTLLSDQECLEKAFNGEKSVVVCICCRMHCAWYSSRFLVFFQC